MRSKLGSEVSLQETIDDIGLGSEVPHELFNSFVLRIDNGISCFNGFLLSWRFILRVFVHDLLKRREEVDILRSPVERVRICFTFAVPSFSVAFNMSTKLYYHVVSENVKDFQMVSVSV